MAEHVCVVNGCGWHQKIIRGYCTKHYQRWKKYGAPELPPQQAPPRRTCTVNGCDRTHDAHGYCHIHYCRAVKYGDPNVGTGRRPNFPKYQGDNHPMWVGDEVTYPGQHLRVKSFRGRATDHPCADCGEQATQWSYDHADPDERIAPNGRVYSTNVDHYQPRCIKCHRQFDRERASA
jgi:hypothetical protein